MLQRTAKLVLHLTVVLCAVARSTSGQSVGEGDDCHLPREAAERVATGASASWTITDAFLDHYTLQDIVDCASEGDVVLLNTSRTVQPRNRIQITKRLTIRAYVSDEVLTKDRNAAKATLTCPPSDPLLLIRNADVVLENVVIRDCYFPEDSFVGSLVTVQCQRSLDETFNFTLSNVEFLNNSNARGSSGFSVLSPECTSVIMDSVIFSQNRYRFGSVFGRENALKNIVVSQNIHLLQGFEQSDNSSAVMQYTEAVMSSRMKAQWFEAGAFGVYSQSLPTALFHFPVESTTHVVDIIAEENRGIVMSVEKGTLTVRGEARFAHNTGQENATIVALEGEVHLTDVQFQSNAYEGQGACLVLNEGSISSLDSVHFVNNSAREGSCIYADSLRDLQIKASVFERNHVRRGGVVSINKSSGGDSVLGVSHCTFKENFGDIATTKRDRFGILLIEGLRDGHVSVRSTAFDSNDDMCEGQTCDSSGSLVIHDCLNVTFDVANSTFHSNRMAMGSGLAFLSSIGNEGDVYYSDGEAAEQDMRNYLHIRDCVFRANAAREGTMLVNGKFVEVHLERSRFENNSALYAGSVISIQGVDAFFMLDCWAENNILRERASGRGQGAACHIKETLQASIQKSTFRNSVVTQDGVGGAFYCSSEYRSTELVAERCRFEQNTAAHGGAIFAAGLCSLSVSDSLFLKNTAIGLGGAVSLQDMSGTKISFKRTNFTDNAARIGGALSMRHLGASCTVQDSLFYGNNASLYGGAIALPTTPSPNSSEHEPLKLTSSSFVENSADYGGAIFIDSEAISHMANKIAHAGAMDTTHSSVFRSNEICWFSRNHAEAAGGAVFAIDVSYIRGLNLKCPFPSTNVSSSTASKISSLRTIKCHGMEENTVGHGGFGPDIAMPSVGTFATLYLEDGTKLSLSEGSAHHLGVWKSGDALPLLEVTAFDLFGQGPARTRSSGMDILLVEGRAVPISKYDSAVITRLHSPDDLFQNDLVGDLTFGRGNITMGSPLVQPGNYSAVLWMQETSSTYLNLTVTARECWINEYTRDDRRECLACDSRHYNFDPENETCKECPKNADCSGVYMLPLPGYWNAFPCSDIIQRGLPEDACLGLNASAIKAQISAKGTDACVLTEEEIEWYQAAGCHEGYRGLLCGSCMDDYAKAGIHRCGSCRHPFTIWLAIILSVAFLAYSSWQQTSASLQHLGSVSLRRIGALTPILAENFTEVPLARRTAATNAYAADADIARMRFVLVLQVTLTYIQLMSAILWLEIGMSETLRHLLDVWDWMSGPVGQVSTFSLECLFPAHGSTPRSVAQTMFTLLVPPALVTSGICSLWWYQKVKQDKPWQHLVKRCTLTVVSVLYVSYFPLVKLASSVFDCVDIYDGTTLDGVAVSHSYWARDTSVRCLVGSHGVLAYVIAAPLLLFALVYPVVLAFVIRIAQRNRALDSPWIQETVGILIVGFSQKRAYWYCVVLLRNSLVALIVGGAGRLSGNFQGSFLAYVFLMFLFIHAFCRPYDAKFRPMNSLEEISLVSIGCTLMSGLMLNSHQASDYWTLTTVEYFVKVMVYVINMATFLTYGYHLTRNKLLEIKYSLRFQGIDVGNGRAVAVLKAFLLHYMKNVLGLIAVVWKSLVPDRSASRVADAEEETSRLLPSTSRS